MTTITQADRANADKAFDIAFRGDTDGIDDAMAELFARAREEVDFAAVYIAGLKQAREEGFNAALAAVYHILHNCGEPCAQCHDAIAALDPAQIVKDKP